MTAKIPTFVVAGNVNQGKSSIVAALAEATDIAIDRMPGTTTEIARYAFHLDGAPVFELVDTPGFQIGTEAEKAGAPGKIMNFMNAMTLVTVPRISVIIRKSYGRAYVCMGGGRHSDEIAAWPSAEVSFMSPEFATKIVHGVGVGEPGFEEAFASIKQGSDVWGLAAVYAAQAVIRPEQTRDYLIRMLDVYRLRITKGVGQHLMRSWPTSY